MLNRLFGNNSEDKKENNGFENKIETKKIVALIKELQQKADEFKSIYEKYGSDSLEYKKYKILVTILDHYKKITSDYDNDQKSLNKDEDIQSLIIVLKKLYFIINEIFEMSEETLKLFRNNDRERVIYGLSCVYLSSVAAAFIFAPLSVSASYFIGTQVLASGSNEKQKPREIDFPVSYLLVKNMLSTLNISIENLNFSLNLKKLEHIPLQFISKQDNMLCPITSELMTEPVVCSLDGFSYEKSAITEWLNPHRTSPMTRKAMLPEQKVTDVLIPNTNLRQLIEDYKLSLKMQASQENEPEQKRLSPN